MNEAKTMVNVIYQVYDFTLSPQDLCYRLVSFEDHRNMIFISPLYDTQMCTVY